MPRENDLEGPQDQGGKHGGQAGMPKPEQPPPAQPQRGRRGDVEADPSTKGKRRRDL